MNKTIISSLISILILSSFASAALGIGFPGEINQEKNKEVENRLILFTFGEDKVNEAELKVIEGQECVNILNSDVLFEGKDTEYASIITKTTEGCIDGTEVKIQLSPLDSNSDSGTIGMDLSIIKSFTIKTVKPTTSTFAITMLAVLIVAVLVLVAAMIKVVKKRN